MGYVDEAFDKLKKTLEITETEQAKAKRRHAEIRDHVREEWDLVADFLTGSYRRRTKTKKLKDVDIFVVIDRDGRQGYLRDQGPRSVLEKLQTLLKKKFGDVTIDRMACVVSFDSEEDIMSFEVVPAFERSTDVFEIPDPKQGSWITTNPKKHDELTSEKNSECEEKFVPLVKMIKGINREADEPVEPSFLMEVMALDLIHKPGRYQDEVRWFLASAADQITKKWADPAGIGPDVNGEWGASEERRAQEFLRESLSIAEEAIRLEDAGQERSAVEEWRRLFGWRMPRPA